MDNSAKDTETIADNEYTNNVPLCIPYARRDEQYAHWLPPEYERKLNKISDAFLKVMEINRGKQSPHKFYTGHSKRHSEAVVANIHRLIPGDKYKLLSELECFYLLGSAWLHDIGMFIHAMRNCSLSGEEIRYRHHELSQQLICEDYVRLGVDEGDADIFGKLAYYHRRKAPLDECPEYSTGNGKGIRLRLLAAYLRLADGLDIDQARVPDEDYAIVMTYGISQEQKIHWIRSKLTKGTIINIDESTITAIVKFPSNLDEFIKKKGKKETDKKEFKRKIEQLYKNSIVEQLKSEVESVKNTLIKNKITTFITVNFNVEKSYFDENLLQQVWIAVDADIFLHGPSSSTVYRIVLETILEITDEDNIPVGINRKNTDEVLENFICSMYATVKNVRRCHFGLIKMLRTIYGFWSEDALANMGVARKEIEASAVTYNSSEIKSILSKARPSVSERIADTLKTIQSLNISLSDDKLAFIKAYAGLLLALSEADKFLIRNNAMRFLENLPDNHYSKFTCKRYIEKAIHSFCNDVPSGDTAKPHMRLGILLYGYSTYAIRTICGFRDYIMANVVSDIVSKYKGESIPFPPHLVRPFFCNMDSESCFEKSISDFFDIYVMEGQPKNIHSWSGIAHHDGYSYCQQLKKRGFTRVTLVADALAGSLLTQYYVVNYDDLKEHFAHGAETPAMGEKGESLFPRIHFLIHGANGFSEKYVYHSAGHLTAICCAIEKGRTQVILATQTSKFLSENKIPDNQQPDDQKTSNRSIPLAEPEIIKKDGWHMQRSYPKEKIRESIFMPYDWEHFQKKQALYTPSEDKIRFSEIDYIITEQRSVHTRELAAQPAVQGPASKLKTPREYVIGPKLLVDRRLPAFDLDETQPRDNQNSLNNLLKAGYENAGSTLAGLNFGSNQNQQYNNIHTGNSGLADDSGRVDHGGQPDNGRQASAGQTDTSQAESKNEEDDDKKAPNL